MAILLMATGTACGTSASDTDAQRLPELCDDASGTYELSLDWGDSPGACGLQGTEEVRWTVTQTGADSYAVTASDSTVTAMGVADTNAMGDCLLQLSGTYTRGANSYALSVTLTELGGLVGAVGTISEGAGGCTQAWNASGSRRP